MSKEAKGTHDYQDDPRNSEVLVYVNGDFVPRQDAKISVFDSGFLLGDGVWEGIRLHNGKFFLRIENIDIGRCKEEFEKTIYDDLSWLGIKYQNAVRRQSDHFKNYEVYIKKLNEVLTKLQVVTPGLQVAHWCQLQFSATEMLQRRLSRPSIWILPKIEFSLILLYLAIFGTTYSLKFELS